MMDLPKSVAVHKNPTTEMPWCELICKDQNSIDDMLLFVSIVDNRSKLSEFDQLFYFRGQANSEWPLQPKIARLLANIKLGEQALVYEYDAITYFKERANIYIPTNSLRKEDIPEWLCLMQHYSAPTRLLDWTTSFFVALYFAVFDSPSASDETDGAVWFFPTQDLGKAMEESKPKRDWISILSNRDNFVNFGINEALPTVMNIYKSDWKSQRIDLQKGVFTFCEKLFCNQANVIGGALMKKSSMGERLPLFKLLITPGQKTYFRAYLSKINVSSATLFPGIDGLGKSIAETLTVQKEAFVV